VPGCRTAPRACAWCRVVPTGHRPVAQVPAQLDRLRRLALRLRARLPGQVGRTAAARVRPASVTSPTRQPASPSQLSRPPHSPHLSCLPCDPKAHGSYSAASAFAAPAPPCTVQPVTPDVAPKPNRTISATGCDDSFHAYSHDRTAFAAGPRSTLTKRCPPWRLASTGTRATTRTACSTTTR
jgi:hypothetical protein